MTKKTDKPQQSNPRNRVEKKYHSNGEIESITPYVNGKIHGSETTYFPSGEIKSKIPYVSGKIHGAVAWWYESGGKEVDRIVDEGIEHGLESWRYESGEKRVAHMRNKNNAPLLLTYWYKSGAKEEETYYIDAEEYSRVRWDEEGNVIEVYYPALSHKQQTKILNLKNHMRETENQSKHLF